MNEQLGVINEIGDLGLGFNLLSEQENEQLKTNKKDNKEDE